MVILLLGKIATGWVAAYTLAAQTVAVLSVVEIGPNLLAAVTSIVGAIVLIMQLRLAKGVRRELNEEVKPRLTEVERKQK